MKYSVIHKKEGALRMTLTYADDGFLSKWERDGEWPIEAWRWFLGNAPYRHQDFLERWKVNPSLDVREVPEDLSFTAFWNAYSYKMGDKKRAEKLWNALSDAERSQALQAVPQYEFWLAKRPTVEKAHATTWLNQRRFENEFK